MLVLISLNASWREVLNGILDLQIRDRIWNCGFKTAAHPFKRRTGLPIRDWRRTMRASFFLSYLLPSSSFLLPSRAQPLRKVSPFNCCIPWEDHGERIARLRAWISSLPSRCAVFAANDISARDIAEAALGVRPPAGHRRREESIPFDNRVEVAVVNQCRPFAHAGAKRQPSHPLHLALFDEFAVHHVVELPLQQDEPQGRVPGEGRDGGIGRVFAELPDALLALGGEF